MSPWRSSVAHLHPRPLTRLTGILRGWTRGRLWLLVLIGMVSGIGSGLLLGPSVGWLEPDTAKVVGSWLVLPGRLFIALVQMIVIPLIFASVVLGLAASESTEQLKTLGLRVTLFFLLTTALATAIGITVATLVRPGDFLDPALVQIHLGSAELVREAPPEPEAVPQVAENLLYLIPTNPLASMVQGQMVQVLVFTIVFGLALVGLPAARARPLLEVLGTVQEVCMTVVRWAMWLAPVAVFGFMAQLTATLGLEALLGMGVYVLTVLGGLLLLLAVYLVLLVVVSGEAPWHFLRQSREALLLAFSTSSSAAVMPISISTAQSRLGVRPSIAQFVIPLGATVNMNGTALYQGVAATFLAQVFGMDLGWPSMAVIVLTAVGASIGSPAAPGVGIVILTMVLDSVGVPAAGIALIMSVDRILDMSRTSINVCGDLVASRVLETWEQRRPPARVDEHPGVPTGEG